MDVNNSINYNIQLGKNGKAGNVDFSKIKSGVTISELAKGDKFLESIFKKLDVDGDNVLNREELNNLAKTINELAGDDGNLSKNEIKNFNGYKLARGDRKALLEFLNNLNDTVPEDVDKVETQTIGDQEVEVVSYKNGKTEEYYPDGKMIATSTSENKKTVSTEQNGVLLSEEVTENEGQDNEIISTTQYSDGVKSQTVINNKGENTTETINYTDGKKSNSTIVGENSTRVISYDLNENPTMELETVGSTQNTYAYENNNKILKESIENKGIDGKEVTKKYDSDGGYTQTQQVLNGKITTIVDKDGKVVSNLKTEMINGKEVSIQLNDDGNIPGVIVQNGETPAAIAKKFGCSVDELLEINSDSVKGKGQGRRFEVGAEIKLPNSVSIEKFNKQQSVRKSADEAKAEYIYDQKVKAAKRQADRKLDKDLRNNLGLINYEGRGKKIIGKTADGKEHTFTIIGKAKFGRTIARDNKGNIHVISHDGGVLKDNYAMNTAKYESVVVNKGTKYEARVNVVGARENDTHGRKVAIAANGQKIIISQDNKILKNDYVAASDNYDLNKGVQRTQTDGVGYGKSPAGQVYYFDDKNQGKAVVGERRAKIVKKDTDYAAQLLKDGADNGTLGTIANLLPTRAIGNGTDEEKVEKGLSAIYSAEILGGVNENLKAEGYHGDKQTMPVEDLILSEYSHSAAIPLFKTLIDSGTMTIEQQAHTVKREIENEVHGGLGITRTEELNDIMQLCEDRNLRLEIEAQFAKEHPDLEPNEGSYVRAYIADDGGLTKWSEQQVDQFDANWIKTGAYQEARIITDETGAPILNEDGSPKIDWGDQNHRNQVFDRLIFQYDDKEALNKGLEAMNDDDSSFDQMHFFESAQNAIEEDPNGKYQARFTNQDARQRYLAGFHLDKTGNVDAGELSASNTLLFKGEKPPRIQAEENLYDVKNGDYSKAFDSMEPAAYAAVAEIIAEGDIPGVQDMRGLYDKSLASVTNPNDKVKIKANAMISGQVEFNDDEIADFCEELMHSIDKNKGIASSVHGNSMTNGLQGNINVAEYQEQQLKAILQNNPQVLGMVKQKIENGTFEVVSNQTYATVTNTFTEDTKQKYLNMIGDTKYNTETSVFYDEEGNEITDESQKAAIIYNNMQSLEGLRQYVAGLERDFKKGVDTEGSFSNAANALSEASGFGTDREDVANNYRAAKLLLQQLESAAQGKLRDADGNVIKMQDLAQDSINQLQQTNENYKSTIETGKMVMIMAPVIVATAGVGSGAAALGAGGWATAAASGIATGAATYGMNAIEYNTSHTGATAEAMERNFTESVVAAGSTFIGAGQMKYIPKMFTKASNFVKCGGRLSVIAASDVGVGAAGEYVQSGDVTINGVAMNALFSVTGNLIGIKALKEDYNPHVNTAANPKNKEGVHVAQDVPATGRNEIADAKVANDIDKSHLNSRDRAMVEREIEAQRTPTEADIKAYKEEYGHQTPTAEQQAALDALHEQNAAEFSQAHQIENNAKITGQNEPKPTTTASEAQIKALENEINGIDGQLNQLNKQLEFAKRANRMGRRNDDQIKKLESQINSLQEKRSVKSTELQSAKPGENTPQIPESSNNTIAEQESSTSGAAAPKATESESKLQGAQDSKVQLEPKPAGHFDGIDDAQLVNDYNEINKEWRRIGQSGDTPENVQAVRERRNDIIKEIRQRGIKVSDDGFGNLVTVETVSKPEVKSQDNANGAAHSPTAEERNVMSTISGNINRAKTAEDLAKAQAWLDKMPECSQKTYLQEQINQKAKSFAQPNSVSVKPQDAVDGTAAPKFKRVTSKEEAVKLYEKLVPDTEDTNFMGENFLYEVYPEYQTSGIGLFDMENMLSEVKSQWKIHIYADSPEEWANVAQVAMPYLQENRVIYKTMQSMSDQEFNIMRTTNSGTQKGKAFTVYFRNEDEFLKTANALESRFKESGLISSGKVSSEAQIGDTGFLSYRHEGAERGVKYKPDDIEDPYLKNLGAQSPSQNAPAPKPDAAVELYSASRPVQHNSSGTEFTDVVGWRKLSDGSEAPIRRRANGEEYLDMRVVRRANAQGGYTVEGVSTKDHIAASTASEPSKKGFWSKLFGSKEKTTALGSNWTNFDTAQGEISLMVRADGTVQGGSIGGRGRISVNTKLKPGEVKQIATTEKGKFLILERDMNGNYTVKTSDTPPSTLQPAAAARRHIENPSKVDPSRPTSKPAQNSATASRRSAESTGTTQYGRVRSTIIGRQEQLVCTIDGKPYYASVKNRLPNGNSIVEVNGKKYVLENGNNIKIADGLEITQQGSDLVAVHKPKLSSTQAQGTAPRSSNGTRPSSRPTQPQQVVITNPKTLQEYYTKPSSKTVTFRTNTGEIRSVRTASDVRKYLTSFKNPIVRRGNWVKLFESNPKRFNRIANSGLFDLIDMGYISELEFNSASSLSINEYRFISNRVLNEASLARDQIKKGLTPSIVKSVPDGASQSYIANNIRIGDVYENKGQLFVRSSENEFTPINMTKKAFDKIFPPVKTSAFQQGKIGDCWLVSAIDNCLDYPKGRAKIFSMFEQVGDDIYVNIPAADKPVKFNNGEVLDAKGKQIKGSTGIQMIEQAYMYHELENPHINHSIDDIADLNDISSQMDILKGGSADFFWDDLGLDWETNHVFYRKNPENTSMQIEEIIRQNANSTDAMLEFSFDHETSKDTGMVEKSISLKRGIYTRHAYSLKSFDSETNTCYLTNPWNSALLLEVPLEDMIKYTNSISVLRFP